MNSHIQQTLKKGQIAIASPLRMLETTSFVEEKWVPKSSLKPLKNTKQFYDRGACDHSYVHRMNGSIQHCAYCLFL